MVWKTLNFVLLEPIKRLFVKEIVGLDNIPKKPPFIIVSNHASYLDGFIILKIVYDIFKQKTHFVAHPGRFGHRLTDTVFIKYFGCIPTDVPSEELFSAVKKTLKHNGIVGIFPEGHYTSDGNIKQFKKGVGRMVLESSVPLVPLALQGTYDICPGPKLIPKFKKAVRVVIGNPINFNIYKNVKILKVVYENITLEIEREIKRLFKK